MPTAVPMPSAKQLKPKRLAMTGVVMLAAGAVIGLVYVATKKRGPRRSADFSKVKKGHVACPGDEGKKPADVSAVQMGDFVIIKLISADDKFTEPAWGRVVGGSEDRGVFLLELASSMDEGGLKGLSTKKHGFGIGERIGVGRDCIYDVLPQPNASGYDILCGLDLVTRGYVTNDPDEAGPFGPVYFEPGKTYEKIVNLKRGDYVEIAIGNVSALPGDAWNGQVTAVVDNIGKTGDVVRALLAGDPPSESGLKRHNEVFFTKDCIISVR